MGGVNSESKKTHLGLVHICVSTTRPDTRRRVLELGAGMGVAGLIAHKTGASAVVMTDGDSSVMKYLNEVRVGCCFLRLH